MEIFLSKSNTRTRANSSSRRVLRTYDYEGNVRICQFVDQTRAVRARSAPPRSGASRGADLARAARV